MYGSWWRTQLFLMIFQNCSLYGGPYRRDTEEMMADDLRPLSGAATWDVRGRELNECSRVPSPCTSVHPIPVTSRPEFSPGRNQLLALVISVTRPATTTTTNHASLLVQDAVALWERCTAMWPSPGRSGWPRVCSTSGRRNRMWHPHYRPILLFRDNVPQNNSLPI